MDYQFSDYHVIVTGGTRGIGAAITKGFINSGAQVTATYRSNDEQAELFRSEINNNRLKTIKFDVANYQDVENFFKEYSDANESLEVLVNNAGIRRDSVVGMMAEEDWQSVINTHLGGTYNMSKFAVQKMMQNRFGRIINISSPSGRMGFAGQANYASAKAGQVAFAKSLCKEVGRRGITVNCVSPGFIDTELLSDLTDEQKKEYRKMIPVSRFGKTSEIANAVMFLASRDASYISGTVLEVSGGL